MRNHRLCRRRDGDGLRRAASLALGAALLGLAACATPVAYQPATGDEGAARYGYSEHRIVGDLLRVQFRGNFRTPLSVVETYALRRAAELTVARGDAWFRVVERGTEKDTERWVSPPAYSPFGFSRFGLDHWDRHWFGPYRRRGLYAPTRRVTRFKAFVVIETRSGPFPAGEPNVYDAGALLSASTPKT